MKKIALIVISVFLAACICTAAFATWHIDMTQTSVQNLKGVKDDILENYGIKKADDDDSTNRIKNYVIYLYPSTLYLNDYLDLLDGKTAIAPEEKYGYIEPVVAQDGSVDYRVAGEKGGDVAYLKDVSQNDTFVSTQYSYIRYAYGQNYDGSALWQQTDASLPKTNVTWYDNGTYRHATQGNLKYLYGNPTDDGVARDYPLSVSVPRTDKNNSAEDTVTWDESGEQHNWRNLHLYDRFGYWPTLAKDEGRYLPIRIEAFEDFTNAYYNRVALTPFSDMCDPRAWFVYSFSCWSYVDTARPWSYQGVNKQYTAPYYAREDFAAANAGTEYTGKNGEPDASHGAFCPSEVRQYFDIIESFERYADENNVIRLFPKFSNGKGYSAKTVADGGGDAVKVVPTYQNEEGGAAETQTLDQHELYTFYTSEQANFSYGTQTLTNIRVSVLSNVDIDGYFALEFKFDGCFAGAASWPGNWNTVYRFGRDPTKEDNKNIPQTIRAYGRGLYNLYLFVAPVVSAQDTADRTGLLENLRAALVSKRAGDGVFESLSGKNLLPIAKSHVNGRSFMLVAEKVREAKYIENLNVCESAEKDYTADVYSKETAIKEGYNRTEKSFRLINNTLFGYGAGDDTTADGDNVHNEFPYSYILQGVDLTEATTAYFQIRFQENYRSDLNFTDENYAYDSLKFAGQLYVHGFGEYFNLVETKVNGYDGTQKFIQLKDEEKRGVYDIILVFRPDYEDNGIAFNIGLYAFRHTNIFVKIYGEDLGAYSEYYETADGAQLVDPDHPLPAGAVSQKFINHEAVEALFTASYPIGVSVKGTDRSDGGTAGDNLLAQLINREVRKHTADPSRVTIKDHVTKGITARYRQVAERDPAMPPDYYFTAEKNGATVYYELIFENFKIRKNYIFYLSYP